MFLSSGDRDLGVAFKVHLGSQASSRVEAKNSDLLSSYDGYLFEPIEWPKWSQASFGVLREDSVLISRPGRKGWALSRDDEGSRGFFKLQRDVWGFLKLRRGTQGASCVAPGKSSLHSSCEGERGIALKSRQGNWASIRVQGGISMSFSSCGRNIWVPSSCDDDLRELLRVPMGSQEYFELRGASRDSTGFGAMEEGLISR